MAAPVLLRMHVTLILHLQCCKFDSDSFGNLFAIHAYCFLCQGASKGVRLERWIVEAVVGAALKEIQVKQHIELFF